MKLVLRLIALLVVCALLAVGIAFWLTSQPYAGFRDSVLVNLPRGSSTRQIAAELASRGVLAAPWTFLALRVLHPSVRLQAGEYEFTAAASPATIFDRIRRGDVHRYEITIPEGSNRFDIARIVASRVNFISEGDFNAVAANPKPIADLAPQAESLEGYLFPSTYQITRSTTAAQLARIMTDQFRAEWKRVAAQNPTAAANVHSLVTLASLVEKETGVPDERPTVASVYTNRLSKGMRLECDPTTIYAAILQNRYKGVIHRSDLDSEHPYNTYRHTGLPPGPIANPGHASLAAALKPAETAYIFFVAKPDGSGRHQFSENLAAHERAVADYRRGVKKRADAAPTRTTGQLPYPPARRRARNS